MDASAVAAELTIDELARQADTTTRNVRAHQSRGLLPPPKVVGRVGYYSEDHLTRLQLIARLQQRGFSLAGIRDVIRAWEQGSSLNELLGLEEALTEPWVDEPPGHVSEQELEELFPEAAADPGLVQRAIDLEQLVPEGDGYRVSSPRLFRQAIELTGVGVPLAAVLEEGAALQADMEAIAIRQVELFRRYVWEPAFRGEVDPGRVAQVTEALRRVRPLGAEAVQIHFTQAMERVSAAGLADQIIGDEVQATNEQPR